MENEKPIFHVVVNADGIYYGVIDNYKGDAVNLIGARRVRDIIWGESYSRSGNKCGSMWDVIGQANEFIKEEGAAFFSPLIPLLTMFNCTLVAPVPPELSDYFNRITGEHDQVRLEDHQIRLNLPEDEETDDED